VQLILLKFGAKVPTMFTAVDDQETWGNHDKHPKWQKNPLCASNNNIMHNKRYYIINVKIQIGNASKTSSSIKYVDIR